MKSLRQLKDIYKHKRLYTLQATCEITLTDGRIQLAIPGAIFHFTGETKGTAKATLPFANLYSIVDHHGVDYLKVDFYDGSLRFGGVQVAAKTCFFTNDSILRTIVLPNNYTTLDLLHLKNENYTEEELAFNNVLHLIKAAERNMYYQIRRSASYLKQYGVQPKELKKLVMEKLNIKLDLDEKNPAYLLSISKEEDLG